MNILHFYRNLLMLLATLCYLGGVMGMDGHSEPIGQGDAVYDLSESGDDNGGENEEESKNEKNKDEQLRSPSSMPVLACKVIAKRKRLVMIAEHKPTPLHPETPSPPPE